MSDASWVEWLVAALLLIGSVFALVGAIGLFKLPDFFMRLHGPTKATISPGFTEAFTPSRTLSRVSPSRNVRVTLSSTRTGSSGATPASLTAQHLHRVCSCCPPRRVQGRGKR